MKTRLLFAAIVIAALVGFYLMTIRPTQTRSPGFSRRQLERLHDARPPNIPPPPLPAPVISMPTMAPPPLEQPLIIPPVTRRREARPLTTMEVPIQDRATIDFSTGAPNVRSDGKDKEAMEKALKEIEEATKDFTFPPATK